MKISISQKQFDMLTKIYRIGVFLLVVALLTTYSYFMNKLVEFIVMFISYFLVKGKFSSQWHSSSMAHCFGISVFVFIIALLHCVPINNSITFCGLMGILMAYISYRISVINRKCKEYDKVHKFTVKTATIDELLTICRIKKLRPQQIEFCLRAFTDYYGKYYTDKELADFYCIELQSVKNKKYLYRKKLEN